MHRSLINESHQRYDIWMSFQVHSKDPSFLGMKRLETFRMKAVQLLKADGSWLIAES